MHSSIFSCLNKLSTLKCLTQKDIKQNLVAARVWRLQRNQVPCQLSTSLPGEEQHQSLKWFPTKDYAVALPLPAQLKYLQLKAWHHKTNNEHLNPCIWLAYIADPVKTQVSWLLCFFLSSETWHFQTVPSFMTPPLHNFLTVHNDNKECVKLMFWNANKFLGNQS